MHVCEINSMHMYARVIHISYHSNTVPGHILHACCMHVCIHVMYMLCSCNMHGKRPKFMHVT